MNTMSNFLHRVHQKTQQSCRLRLTEEGPSGNQQSTGKSGAKNPPKHEVVKSDNKAIEPTSEAVKSGTVVRHGFTVHKYPQENSTNNCEDQWGRGFVLPPVPDWASYLDEFVIGPDFPPPPVLRRQVAYTVTLHTQESDFQEPINMCGCCLALGVSSLTCTECRPTHHFAGMRIGEASNPGPPGLKVGGRGPKGKKRKERDLEGEHNFFECTLACCSLKHYHEKERAPLSGAAKRLAEGKRAEVRKKGADAKTPRVVTFVECQGCDDPHHHHMEQVPYYAREAEKMKSTRVNFDPGPARAAQEQLSSDNLFDPLDFMAFSSPDEEEENKHSTEVDDARLSATAPSESSEEAFYENAHPPTVEERGVHTRKGALLTPTKTPKPLLTPIMDAPPSSAIPALPESAKVVETSHGVDLTIQLVSAHVARQGGRCGPVARFKNWAIKLISHTDDNTVHKYSKTHARHQPISRKMGRFKYRFKPGKPDLFQIMEGYYAATEQVYIYPALMPYLNQHGFEKRGQLDGKVNTNTEAYLRQRLKIMPDIVKYLNEVHTAGTGTFHGIDIVEQTLQYWLQGHLNRHIAANMSNAKGGVPKNYYSGGCSAAPLL